MTAHGSTRSPSVAEAKVESSRTSRRLATPSRSAMPSELSIRIRRMSTDPQQCTGSQQDREPSENEDAGRAHRGSDESERDAGRAGRLRERMCRRRHRTELCPRSLREGVPHVGQCDRDQAGTECLRSSATLRGIAEQRARDRGVHISQGGTRSHRCGIADELQLDVFDGVIPGLKHLPSFVDHRDHALARESEDGRRDPARRVLLRHEGDCGNAIQCRWRRTGRAMECRAQQPREAVDDQGAHRYRGAGERDHCERGSRRTADGDGRRERRHASAGVGRSVDDDLQQRRDDRPSHELRVAPSWTARDARLRGRERRVAALRPARRHPLRPDQAGAAAARVARPTARSTGRSARSRRGR